MQLDLSAEMLQQGPNSTDLGTMPRLRQIFCNRNMRMDRIDMVGFDMDYTLAIYQQSLIDKLSIEATTQKLVERGYPESLLTMSYRTDFPIRGLLVDKERGNTLKMDRYRYVKKAFHGMRELTTDERQQLYSRKMLRPGTARYHWVDTLYALSEVSVYAAAVDELERLQKQTRVQVDYFKLFDDVRTCIDLAHQDGSILDKILAALPDHTRFDPLLADTLHKLRSAGKKLFLLTNSRASYTDTMMHYLIGSARSEYKSWKQYFDVIITAARKPAFFTQSTPFLEALEDGTTKPFSGIFERGKMYMGGNIEEFENLVGVGGDRVLYVGDHIYGDVLRAKKETAWRTAMIIQDLDAELEALERCSDDIRQMDENLHERGTVIEEIGKLQSGLRNLQKQLDQVTISGEAASDLYQQRTQRRKALETARTRLANLEQHIASCEHRIDTSIHPFWGSLFKVGLELSSFGSQVEQYACLYTSRVSNFLNYSSSHYFISPRHLMSHEI